MLHLAKAIGYADRRLDRAWERLAVAWIHPSPQTRLELVFGIRAIPTSQLDGVTCARI